MSSNTKEKTEYRDTSFVKSWSDGSRVCLSVTCDHRGEVDLWMNREEFTQIMLGSLQLLKTVPAGEVWEFDVASHRDD